MRAAHRVAAILCAVALALALSGFFAPQEASAHERRDLLNGKYRAVVGFLTEPAFEDQINGLDLTVTDLTQQVNNAPKPVEGLQDSLKAQVIVGGRTLDLQMQARFGQPGKYAAYFQPTRPGSYIFRVYGTIEGQPIDERFESGPGRFNDVQSLAPLQFPDPVTAPPADLQARLDAAGSAANGARALGIAGLVAGLLGLGAATLALLRRQVPAGTVGSAAGTGGDD